MVTYRMSSGIYLGSGGILHRALIFMLKLGWKSRFRLPVLIVVAFVVLDISMQFEITLEHENSPENHAHL